MILGSYPKVSIIVPAYNSARYIERLIRSFSDQTYRSFEVIFVDDCSDDDTSEIAERYMLNLNINHKVIKLQANHGVGYARNIGIKEADGKYICFVDSDDALKPTFLEKLVDEAEKRNLELVFCAFDEIDSETGCVISQSCERKGKLPNVIDGKACLKKVLKGDFAVDLVVTLFKKELLDESGLLFSPYRRIGEDREFIYKALLEANKVYGIGEGLYLYYRHSYSVTKQQWYEKYRPSYDVGLYLKLIKYVREKGYDSQLESIIKRYSLSVSVLKMLSGFILHGQDDLFWRAVENPRIKEMLKYSYGTFWRRPEIPFKAFLALYFPKVFYNRYLKQRLRSMKG